MAKVPGAEGLLLVNPLRSGKKVESGVAPGRLLRLHAFSTRPYMQNHQYTRAHHPPSPNYSLGTLQSEFYSIKPAKLIERAKKSVSPKNCQIKLQHLHKFSWPFQSFWLYLYLHYLQVKVYKLQEYTKSCFENNRNTN